MGDPASSAEHIALLFNQHRSAPPSLTSPSPSSSRSNSLHFPRSPSSSSPLQSPSALSQSRPLLFPTPTPSTSTPPIQTPSFCSAAANLFPSRSPSTGVATRDASPSPDQANTPLPALVSTLSASDAESVLCVAVEEEQGLEETRGRGKERNGNGGGNGSASGKDGRAKGRIYGGSQGGSIHVRSLFLTLQTYDVHGECNGAEERGGEEGARLCGERRPFFSPSLFFARRTTEQLLTLLYSAGLGLEYSLASRSLNGAHRGRSRSSAGQGTRLAHFRLRFVSPSPSRLLLPLTLTSSDRRRYHPSLAHSLPLPPLPHPPSSRQHGRHPLPRLDSLRSA
jgi:hypothetical protein